MNLIKHLVINHTAKTYLISGVIIGLVILQFVE